MLWTSQSPAQSAVVVAWLAADTSDQIKVGVGDSSLTPVVVLEATRAVCPAAMLVEMKSPVVIPEPPTVAFKV